MSKGAKVCLVGCLTLGYVLAGILVACSFAVLSPLHAGIRQNTIRKSIETGKVYTAGRWNVGLGWSFINFPTTYRTVKFSADAKADAATLLVNSPVIQMECSFQYSLDLSMLIQTYRNFSTSYHTRYVKFAKDIIQRNTDATHYSTPDFYVNRRNITAALFAALVAGLQPSGAIVRGFQITGITLQATTESAIVTNIVQEQNAETTVLNGTIRLVNAETSVIQGQQIQEVQIYLAGINRDASVLTQNANANASALLVSADSTALSLLQSNLTLTNTQTLQYLWLRNLRINSTAAKLNIGVPNAVLSA